MPFKFNVFISVRPSKAWGLGKQLFEFALQEARDLGCDWAWLGVWERNFKAQIFYDKYGFEKFAEHDFPVGDGKVDRDWLLKLKL